MADRRNYIFTHHLRERFVQRSHKRFRHLRSCKKDSCELCRNLVMEIKEILEKRKPIDKEIARRLDAAVECRAYLNNSRLMQWYYEKYGFDRRFEFLVHEDICFVVISDSGKKIVVTCVSSKNYTPALPALRPKFSGIKKRREEEVLKALDIEPATKVG